MAKISIGDLTAAAQIEIPDDCVVAKSKLSQLKATLPDLRNALDEPLSQSHFECATLAATFDKPSLELASSKLCVKGGANCTVKIARGDHGPLFGADDYDPIAVKSDECWTSFELDTLLDVSAAVPLVDGFGVCFEASTAPQFATHLRIPTGNLAVTPSVSQAIARTIAAFAIPDSSATVLRIPQDVIWTVDLSGTVKVGGSWALPLTLNSTCLASTNLPFHKDISVAPTATLKVSGSLALTSEFNVRLRRTNANLLYVGLYKKKGSSLNASFTAGAGLGADLGSTDLIAPFFRTVGGSVTAKSLPPKDAEDINAVLKDCINQCFGISLNAACSAAYADEAVFVYSVDVSAVNQATNDAIASALRGDWSNIAKLPNAKELRNLVIETTDKKFSMAINLLGLYNYRSIAEFTTGMRVLRNDEDGSITITDKTTASRITTAANPLVARPDRLRSALHEGFVTTAVYKALLGALGANPMFDATQNLMEYHDSLGYRSALKQLNAGRVLQAISASTHLDLPASGQSVHHALFKASRKYTNEEVLRFFFSDDGGLTARTLESLKRLGRRIFASLLDPQDPTDQKRVAALQSDATWASFDAQPANVPLAYYPDWSDVTNWATHLARTAPLLADLIRYARTVPGDPTLDSSFVDKRKKLELALASLTKETHAAFDHAFPICVMSALVDEQTHTAVSLPVFEAIWNSKTIFTNAPAELQKTATAPGPVS